MQGINTTFGAVPTGENFSFVTDLQSVYEVTHKDNFHINYCRVDDREKTYKRSLDASSLSVNQYPKIKKAIK